MSAATPRLAPVDPKGRPPGAFWAWRALHGGTGLSTLQLAVPGGVAINAAPSALGWPEIPVVAVARSHAAGLLAAQQFASDEAAAPTCHLVGLVVVADAPGRVPKDLEAMFRLIVGGYPRHWRLPWVEAWRCGAVPEPAATPRAYRDLLDSLIDLVDLTKEIKGAAQ